MIERLTELGFSTQEARVYLALLQHPSATGYEVAKVAGLQRANVYQVLASLTEDGVIDRVSEATPARFVAHPPRAVLGRIKRRTAERADALIAELAALAAPREPAAFYSLRDRDSVIERSASLVAEAKTRIAVCAWADDLDWLATGLQTATRSGRQVVLNVFGDAELEDAEIFRHEAAEQTVGRRLLMIAVDFETALVASLDDPVGAVVTEHPSLVALVEKVVRDEAYLAAIYARFGDQLEAEFGPHLIRLRTRLLPPDDAERLITIVGFGAGDDALPELLDQHAEEGT